MIPIRVPTTDVNSETGTLARWLVPDRARVREGDPVAEVETSKAVFDVAAPADGFLLQEAAERAQVALDAPIAHVFEDAASLEAHAAARVAERSELPSADGPRATAPARRRAAELGIDLASVRARGVISVRDVEAAWFAARTGADSVPYLPALAAPVGTIRVALIGAGSAAMQVMEILRGDAGKHVVGLLDDTPSKRGKAVAGVPVIGRIANAGPLRRSGAFDAVVIAIGEPVEARRKFRLLCESQDVPLVNAVDPSARIASDATLGTGNVICAFVHVATGAVLGDNNFVSAYNSFDHHSRVGSDSSTGPGCMTSGNVTLGDGVRLGTGIFVQPGVRIGHGARVASGAVIVRDVPDGHAVKTRVVTTVVVPIDG